MAWKISKYFNDNLLKHKMAMNTHAFSNSDPISEWIDVHASKQAFVGIYHGQKRYGCKKYCLSAKKLKERLNEVIPTLDITGKQLHLNL